MAVVHTTADTANGDNETVHKLLVIIENKNGTQQQFCPSAKVLGTLCVMCSVMVRKILNAMRSLRADFYLDRRAL